MLEPTVAVAVLRWPSRLCFCSFCGVSKRCVQPWYVHVYVPESAADDAGFCRRSTCDCEFCEPSGSASLALDSIDVRCAGKSGGGSDADGMLVGVER